jgi:predicted Rossmann fold flavoprotein
VTTCDVLIIGAGAAGMMCAIEAGRRGRRVRLVDHADKIGEKIRISGGGHCNFTHLDAAAANYLSRNPHFCKSALKRYPPRSFLALIERHGIAWREKAAGQLFCVDGAQQIIDMLLAELAALDIRPETGCEVGAVGRAQDGFRVGLAAGETVACGSLVIATGGKSVPKIGASGFGLELARQLGLAIVEPRPALVPLTLADPLRSRLQALAGVGLSARVSCNGQSFTDALLITHRGLSGPAILQISSYWREGDEIGIDLLPGTDLMAFLKAARGAGGKQHIDTVLSQLLPQRLAEFCCEEAGLAGRLADHADKRLAALVEQVKGWRLRPAGSEGYRTAEVMLGGVDTDELSSKTFAAKKVPGLYFIGEVVDVTGWLGGYNFQWAWSSGWCAGQYV